MRHARRGFTLIELLVVVAIIVALLAILMPSMGRAVEAAYRAACASNLHQTHIADVGYAANHFGALPRGSGGSIEDNRQASVFYDGAAYDLRPIIRPYLVNFEVWTCPATDAAPIDDERNTRVPSYSNYRRFVGRIWPEMGDPLVNAARVSATNATARHTMMQDNLNDWYNGQYTSGIVFNFNHGRGALAAWVPGSDNNNPSNRTMTIDHLDKFRLVDGANAVFYDGHAQWTGIVDAQPIGYTNANTPGRDFGFMP